MSRRLPVELSHRKLLAMLCCVVLCCAVLCCALLCWFIMVLLFVVVRLDTDGLVYLVCLPYRIGWAGMNQAQGGLVGVSKTEDQPVPV